MPQLHLFPELATHSIRYSVNDNEYNNLLAVRKNTGYGASTYFTDYAHMDPG